MSRAKVLITFLFYIDITISGDIEIDRLIPRGIKGNWKDTIDMFIISPSLCRQWNQYCSTVCRTAQGGYSCSCPGESATLTYHNNEWRCRKNAMVRTELGCVNNNMFKNEETDHKLRTLNTLWSRQTRLTETNCVVNISSSWYIGCHGEKLPINESDVFSLNWDASRCRLAVQNVAQTDRFKGRVINLGINKMTSACLLFKLEGHIKCAVNKTPVLDPTSTSIPITVMSKSSAKVPTATSTLAIVTPSTPSKTPAIVPTATSTIAIVTELPSTTSKLFPEKTTHPTTGDALQATFKPISGNKQQRVSSSSLKGVIIGVTVSIATVLLLIAAIFFYRRHNARKSSRTSTDGSFKKKTLEKTNEALQPEARAQDGYVTISNRRPRTSHSGDLYASLDVPEGHNIYGHGNTDEPFYNVVQEPSLDNEEDGQRYGSLRLEPPVYHTVEDLPDEHPGNAARTDPVYNVLEEPFPRTSERAEGNGTLTVNEPFYNTLEQSQSNDDPQPTSDEPVYNTLEDPYNNGAGDDENYGSMGLQDPVYNVLEGPGTDEMEVHISDDKNIPVYAVAKMKKK